VSFDLPILALLAPAVGVVLLGLAWLARRRRIRVAEGWSSELGQAARRRARYAPLAVAITGALAMVGAAGPRWGSAEVETETRALNLVVAIDISRSMLAEDVKPNRLEHAIRESRRLLQDARGDRVALLAFAGRSYILTPLTLDQGAVLLQLDALDPDVASEGGTELASVIRQGAELLDAASEGGARAMVLFTDGEGHDSLGSTLEAARALRGAGVTLIVVGTGGDRPTRIPLRDPSGALLEYKKDQSGADVMTARRDDVLRAMADAAEGVLVPGQISDQAGVIWKTLAGLDRASTRGRRTEDLIPRAWLLALGAALVLGVQAAVRRTAALLGVLLGLGLAAGTASAQRPARATRDLARGHTTSLSRFLAAATAGRAGDTSWYNAGTVALATRDWETAEKALGTASGTLDPTLRFRTLYNLGLAALERSRSDTASREQLEAEARQRFRDALLIEPGSVSAKWNLELVTRPKPPSSGGGGNSPKGGGQSDRQQEQQSSSAGLSRSEAEQILASVERTEAAVRADQLRRRRVARSAATKDW